MKLSRYVLPTMKEDPSDAVVTSHRLMMRAGLIRKESAGMYIYLPLGFKVLNKVINIIREEMNKSGALEFLMPEMTNADLWKESGRWDTMGPEMIRIKDRNDQEYTLAPTHEESFTAIARSLLSSYRDLPVNFYQINTKFRDEIRPRFGVMRSKEFIMKDAYSFDMDEKGLEDAYQIMRKTYRRIFERCGLETIPVEADTGSMGGSNSEEFMVASEVGEEALLLCSCGYRANQERAEYYRTQAEQNGSVLKIETVDTPNVKTINELVSFFNVSPDTFMKSIVYLADNKPVMAVVPGDREINELKLKNYLGAIYLALADDSVVEQVTSAPVGFAGPVNNFNVKTVFDISISNIRNGITGANMIDKHFKNVNPGIDFQVKEEADITTAVEGDLCPKCQKQMTLKRGIEVGHIFKLGNKYTKAMNMTVVNEKSREINPVMGCYGIGVNRTIATIIEQNNDERGIIWPISVAPFHIHLIGIAKTEEEFKAVDDIYSLIVDSGLEVLYDDRKASPGFKFADADLVGIPVRITIGKSYFSDNLIEIKLRASKEIKRITKESLLSFLKELKDLINNEQLSIEKLFDKLV